MTHPQVAFFERELAVVSGSVGPMRVKDAVGRYGEELAAQHLAVTAGMRILDRNWRCADGELDIVAKDGRALVFVEVKTRSSLRFGDPAEAVTPEKAARLRRLALLWLADHPGHGRRELRFDVVGIVRGEPPAVQHFRAAF